MSNVSDQWILGFGHVNFEPMLFFYSPLNVLEKYQFSLLVYLFLLTLWLFHEFLFLL